MLIKTSQCNEESCLSGKKEYKKGEIISIKKKLSKDSTLIISISNQKKFYFKYISFQIKKHSTDTMAKLQLIIDKCLIN